MTWSMQLATRLMEVRLVSVCYLGCLLDRFLSCLTVRCRSDVGETILRLRLLSAAPVFPSVVLQMWCVVIVVLCLSLVWCCLVLVVPVCLCESV